MSNQKLVDIIIIMSSKIEDIIRCLLCNGKESEGFKLLSEFVTLLDDLLSMLPIEMLADELPPLLKCIENDDVIGICDRLLVNIQPILSVLYDELTLASEQ